MRTVDEPETVKANRMVIRLAYFVEIFMISYIHAQLVTSVSNLSLY